MSDTWNEIQAIKNKQINLKERIAARKKQVAELSSAAILSVSVPCAASTEASATIVDFSNQNASPKPSDKGFATNAAPSPSITAQDELPPSGFISKQKNDLVSKPEDLSEIEKILLTQLTDISLNLPVDVVTLYQTLNKTPEDATSISSIENLIQKYAVQSLITISSARDSSITTIESVDHKKLTALYELEFGGSSSEASASDAARKNLKRKLDEKDEPHGKSGKQVKKTDTSKSDQVIESLLSTQSAKERETKKLTEDILQLLSKPTTKERLLTERFRSQGGRQVREFCSYGTREECQRSSNPNQPCQKLHFKKIIHKHTDESLGDCSFLNTCFHMDTCKYVHYQIECDGGDGPTVDGPRQVYSVNAASRIWTDMSGSGAAKFDDPSSTTLFPPQWIQCDLRHFDMSVLGKFAVVMADPPWDIHMELPYGTMSDDEMRKLNIPFLQDDGYIFLWVTGRAMELGRECLTLWGYERVDELIWVKTNQLQRIIRTGRTGHWLNHGKEHCLVGVKGNLKGVNRGLDCDVIVSEVRATSHKPDEIYGIIERLSPGTRKIELFGRPHNIQPNWVTLGNQVDGVKLIDPEVVRSFKEVYPDGNPMK